MNEKKEKNSFFGKIRNFWLFGKSGKELTTGKRAAFAIYNILFLILGGAAIGALSLTVSYGEMYSRGIFFGYFQNGYIVLLNLLPPVILMFLLYGLAGRAWIAFLADSVLTLGFTFASFYLLRFRDDPLMFSDILYIKEAASISKEGYDYTPTRKMLVCVAAVAVFTVFLALFVRAKAKIPMRILSFVFSAAVIFSLRGTYSDTEIYDIKTQNYEHINRWSSTQQYISKGFVYPFIHSVFDAFGKEPANYNPKEAEEILKSFEPKSEDGAKVNIISVMLEAFCDLETLGIEGINPDAYAAYRKIRDENYSGTLITNIFAGGTIDSERAFLTGYADIDNYRKNLNSYVRTLGKMGYYTTGNHPSQGWFYNRRNVNGYLGFDEYFFSENYFYEKYGDNMRLDSVAFPEIWASYEAKADGKTPYFSFNVTYQGHGPYSATTSEWGDGTNFGNESISEEYNRIVDNYLGSVKDTGYQLEWLVEKIKQSEEPCVLLFFGDHKPWLGDGNSVYHALGVNLDVSTEEGFRNYYGTEYVMVANDAAKKLLDDDFSGKGEITSPCMLMSVLFDKLGLTGDCFMNYTRSVRENIPALNLVGAYDGEGNFRTLSEFPEELAKIYNEYMRVAYYRSTSFEKD